MSDYTPYNFETIGREGIDPDCDVVMQAEYWMDVKGHYVHTALVMEDLHGDTVSVLVPDAATARRLKNLMAKIERRLA